MNLPWRARGSRPSLTVVALPGRLARECRHTLAQSGACEATAQQIATRRWCVIPAEHCAHHTRTQLWGVVFSGVRMAAQATLGGWRHGIDALSMTDLTRLVGYTRNLGRRL